MHFFLLLIYMFNLFQWPNELKKRAQVSSLQFENIFPYFCLLLHMFYLFYLQFLQSHWLWLANPLKCFCSFPIKSLINYVICATKDATSCLNALLDNRISWCWRTKRRSSYSRHFCQSFALSILLSALVSPLQTYWLMIWDGAGGTIRVEFR